jgi:hypothetical protein
LRPSEVLQRSLEAALRLRELSYREIALCERIGVQGHTSGRAPKNDIRDPMRHVIEMLDGLPELEAEREPCERDVADGCEVVDGLRAVSSLDSEPQFGYDGEYVLDALYVRARPVHEVAESMGIDKETCQKIAEEAVKHCDEMGYAVLRGAAGWQR